LKQQVNFTVKSVLLPLLLMQEGESYNEVQHP